MMSINNQSLDTDAKEPVNIKVEPLSYLPEDVKQEQDPLEIKNEKQPVPILPKPPLTPAALLIPVIGTVIPPDPLSLDALCPVNNSLTVLQWDQKPHPRLMSADQKRRHEMKNSVYTLQTIIPDVGKNTKLSNGTILQKAGKYIQQLKSEREKLCEEAEELRQEIKELDMSIKKYLSKWPGIKMSESVQTPTMKEMLDEYVRKRSKHDWKFWIFGLLLGPLLDLFESALFDCREDDLHKSTIQWIDQQCQLMDLCPIALQSLKYISTETDILNDPDNFCDEVRSKINSCFLSVKSEPTCTVE